MGIPSRLLMCESRRMRDGITFTLSTPDRQRLDEIAAAPRSPQKHVWRARIVLLSGDGLGTSAIMAQTCLSPRPTHSRRSPAHQFGQKQER